MTWWTTVSEGFSDYFGENGDGWGDLFEGIMGGLQGEAESRGSTERARIQGEYGLRGVREGGRESRQTSEYQALLGKWLKDKEKEDRRKGLSNYARMSSVDYGAPSYIPPAVGDMPTAGDFDARYYDDKGNRRSLTQAARNGG